MRWRGVHALLLCVCLMAGASCSSPPQQISLSSGQRVDPATLREAVSLAIVWQRYWVLGESQAQIQSYAASHPALTGRVSSFSPSGEVSVFLEDLRWRVDVISDTSGRWRPWYVDQADPFEHALAYARYRILHPDSPPGEPPETYQPPAHDPLVKETFCISRQSIEQVCHPQVQDNTRVEQIVHAVAHRRDVVRFLRQQRESKAPTSKLWMSTEVRGVPRIYYYVDGVPYLGIIDYDLTDGPSIHDDLEYIRERPNEADYQHIIDRLHKIGRQEEYSFAAP